MPKTTNPLKKKSRVDINIVLTLVVVVIAVAVIGGILMFSGKGGNGNAAAPDGSVPAETLIRPDSNKLTESPDGKVQLVEFLDYQCPSCAQYYKGITKQIEQDYQGKVTFATRNFPMESAHPLAMPAATATEAAAKQGKYKEMYHAIYDNWESWAVAPNGQQVNQDVQKGQAQFDQFAQQAGLDMQKFHQDQASPEVKQKIEQDRADAEKAGVQGTPSIFLNGKQFEPQGKTYQEVSQQLRSQIDQELAK